MKANLFSVQDFESIENRLRQKAVSNFIKGYRINSGITQQQLSELSNLSRNTIINAESGKNITLSSLFELLDALDVCAGELFQDIK